MGDENDITPKNGARQGHSPPAEFSSANRAKLERNSASVDMAHLLMSSDARKQKKGRPPRRGDGQRNWIELLNITASIFTIIRTAVDIFYLLA